MSQARTGTRMIIQWTQGISIIFDLQMDRGQEIALSVCACVCTKRVRMSMGAIDKMLTTNELK